MATYCGWIRVLDVRRGGARPFCRARLDRARGVVVLVPLVGPDDPLVVGLRRGGVVQPRRGLLAAAVDRGDLALAEVVAAERDVDHARRDREAGDGVDVRVAVRVVVNRRREQLRAGVGAPAERAAEDAERVAVVVPGDRPVEPLRVRGHARAGPDEDVERDRVASARWGREQRAGRPVAGALRPVHLAAGDREEGRCPGAEGDWRRLAHPLDASGTEAAVPASTAVGRVAYEARVGRARGCRVHDLAIPRGVTGRLVPSAVHRPRVSVARGGILRPPCVATPRIAHRPVRGG